MNYSIEYSKQAEESLKKFKKSNLPAFKKAVKILAELVTHPRSGTGHPEQLKEYKQEIWSRHITKRDRIVYEIKDSEVLVIVIDLETHYRDH